MCVCVCVCEEGGGGGGGGGGCVESPSPQHPPLKVCWSVSFFVIAPLSYIYDFSIEGGKMTRNDTFLF